jgi:hypothetical protein
VVQQDRPPGECFLAFADAWLHRQVERTSLVDSLAAIGGELADLI